jgi:hypothetical protein
MTPLVQVGPVEQLRVLDAALAQRGWAADGHTGILVARELAPGGGADVEVTMRAGVDREWVDAWVAAESRPDAEETYARVLSCIRAPAGFAIARVDGAPAGVGIAACDSGWSGVFCVATVPVTRRRGVARACSARSGRGRAGRARRGMYLQVELDNAPARAFYASVGFTRSHGYDFRVAPRAARSFPSDLPEDGLFIARHSASSRVPHWEHGGQAGKVAIKIDETGGWDSMSGCGQAWMCSATRRAR